MRRPRKYSAPFQLEFTVLVAAAENASRETATRLKARRKSEGEKRRAIRLLETPWLFRDGFSQAWLDSAVASIKKCASLREVITLTACYLSELLDMIMRDDGGSREWRGKYEEFCDYKISLHTDSADENERVLRTFWEVAGDLLTTYNALNNLSDWSLLENVDTAAINDWKASDFHGRESFIRDRCCDILSFMHFLEIDDSPEESEEDTRTSNA